MGRIIECKKHENADKLYVSKIQVSKEPEDDENGKKLLQVCSGLVEYIPIDKMQNRNVIVLTNLKSSKIRNVESQAMLLAAEKYENGEQKPEVRLLQPPPFSEVGEGLYFYPFSDDDRPSRVIKQNVWKEIQKHLKTNLEGKVVYVTEGSEHPLKTKDVNAETVVCDLKNATVR